MTRPRLSNADAKAGELGDRVGKIVRAAGITKPKPCHIFRHTVATRTLNNGAELRFVQQFLGHEDITTTQRYTHAAIEKLRADCDSTHPASVKPKAPSPSAEQRA